MCCQAIEALHHDFQPDESHSVQAVVPHDALEEVEVFFSPFDDPRGNDGASQASVNDEAEDMDEFE